MSGLVIDNSAAINLLRGIPPVGLSVKNYFAPDVIDLEFANTLRKLVLRQKLSAEIASRYLREWAANDLTRCPHTVLLPRIWQLRNNITPYDASYVALAEALGIPLATADRRLARAAAEHCEVVLIEG